MPLTPAQRFFGEVDQAITPVRTLHSRDYLLNDFIVNGIKRDKLKTKLLQQNIETMKYVGEQIANSQYEAGEQISRAQHEAAYQISNSQREVGENIIRDHHEVANQICSDIRSMSEILSSDIEYGFDKVSSNLLEVKWTLEQIFSEAKALIDALLNSQAVKARELYKQGTENYRLGYFSEAKERYLKALKFDNTNEFIHINLGFIYQRESDTNKAIEHFKKAADFAENNFIKARSLQFLGRSYFSINDQNQACNVIKEAVIVSKSEKNHLDCTYDYSKYLLLLKKEDEAYEYANEIIRKRPEYYYKYFEDVDLINNVNQYLPILSRIRVEMFTRFENILKDLSMSINEKVLFTYKNTKQDLFSILNNLENLYKADDYSQLIEAFNIYNNEWNRHLEIACKKNEEGRKERSELFEKKDYFENKILPEAENAIINVKNLEYVYEDGLRALNYLLKGLRDRYQAVLITDSDRESISNGLKVLNMYLSDYKSLFKPVVEKMIGFSCDKIIKKLELETDIKEIKNRIKPVEDSIEYCENIIRGQIVLFNALLLLAIVLSISVSLLMVVVIYPIFINYGKFKRIRKSRDYHFSSLEGYIKKVKELEKELKNLENLKNRKT